MSFQLFVGPAILTKSASLFLDGAVLGCTFPAPLTQPHALSATRLPPTIIYVFSWLIFLAYSRLFVRRIGRRFVSSSRQLVPKHDVVTGCLYDPPEALLRRSEHAFLRDPEPHMGR